MEYAMLGGLNIEDLSTLNKSLLKNTRPKFNLDKFNKVDEYGNFIKPELYDCCPSKEVLKNDNESFIVKEYIEYDNTIENGIELFKDLNKLYCSIK